MPKTYTKVLMCLANSRKPSGACVAGKEIENGEIGSWIRPVSNRPTEEISWQERRCTDGSEPKLLDIVSVPLLRPKPTGFQSENHLIDSRISWTKVGRANWSQASSAVDKRKGPLWINEDSSYSGRNDRVSAESASALRNSLFLLRPTNLEIIVNEEGAEFGNPRRRVRAVFHFSGEYYKFSVTDPLYRDYYLKGSDGVYPIQEALLCVSLGLVHCDGFAYKLVAAIITPERIE